MNKTILICTVGGSHKPILQAIRESAPDHVVFVCTGKDPASGKPGSDRQIVGAGSVIKAHPADDKPSLPNIPAQAGLRPAQYEVVEVLADDLDCAFDTIRMAMADLSGRFAGARFLADYTGGTKTMTAALVIAALESEDVDLQLVTGSRVDLVQVKTGMESVLPANVESIRFHRAVKPLLATWARFDYAAAAQGLANVRTREPALRADLLALRDVSRALDAWDRFDHATAYDLLDAYRQRLAKDMQRYYAAIGTLNSDTPRREPARLFDLWRNARRRAVQGRYDDAVARVYRLLEWFAQWVLKAHCGFDTADVPVERVPDGMHLGQDAQGRQVAGLMDAWRLVVQHTGGPAAAFFGEQQNHLRRHLEKRNASILAHGFKPVDEPTWRDLEHWIEAALLPALRSEAKRVRLDREPPQLPVAPPWYG